MTVEPFRIQISEDVLNDLKYRLDHIRWPAPLEDSDWQHGTDMEYLQSLVSYWKEQYDWRSQEARLNRFTQYRSTIDGVDIHFIHERGKGSSPLPLILTHGWPDSFLRYQSIIPLLTDPARYGGDPEDSFDVIVPSIPGFGFSGLPGGRVLNNSQVSGLWAKLMTDKLGYSRFAAGGGDMGSGITRYMAASRPELLAGIHLTDIGILRELLTSSDQANLTEEERQYKQSAQAWISQEGGYMSIQSTKPQTLSYGLTDSPVGLAAWIIEKFHGWSDCKGDLRNSFSMDDLLTNIMIYWVTNTAGSTARIYYENSHFLPALGRIEVPTGVALFAADVLPPPKQWAERKLNITRWTSLPSGGHFPAMEEPELLAADIRAFFRPQRTNQK